MANAFDSSNYPESEPTRLQAGDRWMWKRTDLATDYPTADYSLTYVARLNGAGSTTFTLTSTETATEYLVEIPSATTASYTAGTYAWVLYITRTSDSERVELARGTWEVTANRATSTADPRSFARKALDAIEAYLADSNNVAAASYQINGRSLSRFSRADLYTERDRLKAEVLREENAEKLKRGLGVNSKISVRFYG